MAAAPSSVRCGEEGIIGPILQMLRPASFISYIASTLAILSALSFIILYRQDYFQRRGTTPPVEIPSVHLFLSTPLTQAWAIFTSSLKYFSGFLSTVVLVSHVFVSPASN